MMSLPELELRISRLQSECDLADTFTPESDHPVVKKLGYDRVMEMVVQAKAMLIGMKQQYKDMTGEDYAD